MSKTFEMPCLDGRKSFYGKAHVTEYANGWKILTSYNTDVIAIDGNGKTYRLWAGYSATTMRHINSLLNFYGIPENGGKAWWDNKPVESIHKLSIMIDDFNNCCTVKKGA